MEIKDRYEKYLDWIKNRDGKLEVNTFEEILTNDLLEVVDFVYLSKKEKTEIFYFHLKDMPFSLSVTCLDASSMYLYQILNVYKISWYGMLELSKVQDLEKLADITQMCLEALTRLPKLRLFFVTGDVRFRHVRIFNADTVFTNEMKKRMETF